MDLLLEKYVYLIGIGVFILFSLIGYLVELIKKSNEQDNNKEIQLVNIKNVDDVKLNELITNKNVDITNNVNNISNEILSEKDVLLEDYNKGDL